MSKIKLYILPLILLIVSCDILQTRNPEDPEISRNSFKPAISPEILFENLQNAFSQKNSEGYRSCFGDYVLSDNVLKFVPSSTAAASDPALLNWDVEKEFQYFFNLVQGDNNSVIKLDLQNEEWNTIGENRIYKYDYTITLSLPTDYKVYAGTSQFLIQLDNKNQWIIVEWIDIQSKGSLTWSDLKGAYY